MRDLILRIDGGLVKGGCLHCRGDFRVTANAGDRDVITFCPSCLVEHRVDVSIDGGRVKIRLPFNADAWFKVESSNLHAAGCRGADLIVRFKNGGTYLYPNSGGLLPELLAAESKGRFFHARIRALPCTRLI